MFRTTFITALFLSGTFAFSQSVGNSENQRLSDKPGAVETPATAVPNWADAQVPESPRRAETPTNQFNPPDPPADPPPVPVDGGLGLLALAGAGFAASRLRQRGKNVEK